LHIPLKRSTIGVAVILGLASPAVVSSGLLRQRPTPAASRPDNVAAQWVGIGPSPLNYLDNPSCANSGRVAAIAADPGDATHWLLGVGNGGVWETRNAGASWSPRTDTAPTLATGAIAFAPSNPQIIYVGTGESGIGIGFTHSGVGILKSVNGGQSFALIGQSSFNRAAVKRIRVHPTNPNVVVAATTRAGFGRDNAEGQTPSQPPFGILRSTDGGTTWAQTLPGQATALEVDPTNFNSQYAAIGDQRIGLLNDSPGQVNGVYRSTDAGLTWSSVTGLWSSPFGRVELAIAPSNPNVLYASFQVDPLGGTQWSLLGLFRTDTAWAATPTWIQVPTDQTGPGGFCGPSKCGYTHVLSVDPSDANRLFAGGGENGHGGLWRCTNCGVSPIWSGVIANQGCVHPDHHALTWAGTRLLDGNDGGIWSTPDYGATWQNHNNGLATPMFYSGALHPSDPNFILGGLRDYAPSVHRQPGSAWSILPGAPTSEWGEADVAISSSRPDTDWMGAWITGVIQRTTDGGLTITRADGDIPDQNGGVAFVAPITKCPADDNVFLTGTLFIWRTTNFFNSVMPTWVSNGPVDPGTGVLSPTATLLSIAFAVNGTCNTYVYGTRGGRLHLTQNAGGAWTDVDAGHTLPARPVNGLAFDPTNPNVLYVGYSNFDDATPGHAGHVFKTTNALSGSPSWTNVSPPVDVPFNVVAVDPGNPQLVYAGSDTGLWHSTNGGANWIADDMSVGLPPASIYDIQIQLATNKIVVFTYGRGAFSMNRPFTDDPLQPGQTLVKGVHIIELRGRINAQRARFGLALASWTDLSANVPSTAIKAVHLSELRAALDAAYTAHGMTPPPYTDPTLTAAITLVKAMHISELRAAVLMLESTP